MADDVSKHTLDAETLAAFFDGTLSSEERSHVLRVLAESPDAYADFIEASAIHRELTPSEATVRPLDGSSTAQRAPSRWRSARVYLPLALAAGITILFVARRPTAESSGRIIALAESAAAANGTKALGAGWDQPPWASVRGGDDAAGTRNRAFRSGVYITELEYAVRLGDSAAVRRASDALARVAGAYDAGAAIAARFKNFSSSAGVADEQVRATTAGQLRALGRSEDWFDLGAWTEVARLSVRANNLSMFQKDAEGQRLIGEIVASLNAKPAGESATIVAALRPIAIGRSWTQADRDSLSAMIDRVMSLAAR